MRRSFTDIHRAYRFAVSDAQYATKGQPFKARRAAEWRVYDDYIDALIAECDWCVDRAIAFLPAPYMVR